MPDVPKNEKSPKRPRRVQLDFTPTVYERLKELVVIVRADSIADMFRDALRVYEWYRTRKEEGYKILLEKDGKRTEVDLGL